MTTSPNPLQAVETQDDAALAIAAAAGESAALDQLVRCHQRWIYNVALRFMLNPSDAHDLAQEAMVRIVTRIGQFEGRSAFRTWAYRIVANCFVDSKRGGLENAIQSFESYGAELDSLPLQTLPQDLPDRPLLIQEAKIGCMLGMLLCLSREQRLAYILGEIFEASSEVAAEILEISPAAFRKRLQRARADLVAFMNDKCGLLNPDNPCRCEKKTKAFIDAGWVDPNQRKFAAPQLQTVEAFAPSAARRLDDLIESQYAALFRDHPMYEGPDLTRGLAALLEDAETRQVFQLDS